MAAQADRSIEDELRERVAATAFYRELGISLVRAVPGNVELTCSTSDGQLNVQGFVHGGLLATLADSAMGLAVRSALEPGRRHVTIELGLHYVRPARPGRLVAGGRTIRVGTSVAFAAADITEGDGRLLATATGTYSVTADADTGAGSYDAE
jgi:uncharacterized protein (TIGR00369 family)